MDIILIHPPPWRISGSKEPGDEPSRFSGPLLENEDFLAIPYGLLSIAAQALRAGRNVVVLNLSNFPWKDVELFLSRTSAALYGLSCYTSNRRGAAETAELIRRLHPGAFIVAGGPHVTALPRETLRRCRALDALVLGEGEESFMEIIARLENGSPVRDMAGVAWRQGDDVVVGPPRRRLDDLDALASPLDYFPVNMVITSRGCPERCTYCASRVIWGSKLRFHSAAGALDMMEKAVRERKIYALAVKDDTFTADRKRALAICRGILDRGLNLIWSCDTRADYLDPELLHMMRLAGCQRISLGVESASQTILDNIRKRITPEQVLEATRAARRLGVFVRYYLMAGNRGETLETLEQTRRFLETAQPDDYLLALLTMYPGSEEFELLCREIPQVTPEIFFTHRMVELEWFAGDQDQAPEILTAALRLAAARRVRRPGVEECRAVLQRLPRLHLAHLDLAGAYFRAGMFDACRTHLDLALDRGYPFPFVIHNYLACMAAETGDWRSAQINLRRAGRSRPAKLIQDNEQRLEAWLAAGGPASGRGPGLTAVHDFEVVSHLPPVQPCKPGSIILHGDGSEPDRVLGA